MNTAATRPFAFVSGTSLPDEFLELTRAWRESRIVFAALELDLFTAVGDGASSHDVAARRGLDPRGTDILLHALAALGLLEKHDGVFRNGALADRFLREGAPHDQRVGLLHEAHLRRRWAHLEDCVRTGQPAPRDEGTQSLESFIAAMHMNATSRAPQVLRALDLSGLRRALDLGGGSGGYAIALALAVPGARVDVVDRADVVPLTRRYAEAAGVGDRVSAREGDLLAGDLGSGYDLALLSSVCHMLGPGQNADLIARAARTLVPEGQLVVQDYILDPDRTSPRAAAIFAVNMLVNTPTGTNYTEQDYFGWMRAAGLVALRYVQLGGPTGLLIGTRE